MVKRGVLLVGLALLVALTSLSGVAYGLPGTGLLSGKVTAVGGAALEGVAIELSVSGGSGTSIADGTYSISGVAAGTYKVTFSKPGYATKSTEITIVEGSTLTRDMTLVPFYIAKVPSPFEENRHVSISGDRIVWEGHDPILDTWDVFTWKAGDASATRLTTNLQGNPALPAVSGDRVAWYAQPNGSYRMFTWTPVGGVQEIPGTYVAQNGPHISGDRIVWDGTHSGNSAILTWSPSLSGSQVVTESPTLFFSGSRVSGDHIVFSSYDWTWYSVYGCMAGGTPVRLDTLGTNAQAPEVDGSDVVWEQGPYPYDIWGCVPGSAAKLNTDAGEDHWGVRLSEGRVIWSNYADSQLYMWTPGSGQRQITTDGLGQSFATISGDRVAWCTFKSGAGQVFTWVADGGTAPLDSGEISQVTDAATGYNWACSTSAERIVWTSGVNGNSGEVWTAVEGDRPGVLKGKVTGPGSVALAGVTVTLSNSAASALTAADGTYTIADAPAGESTVTFTKTGYQTKSTQVDVAPGGTLTQDASLVPLQTPPATTPSFGSVAGKTLYLNAPLAGVKVVATGPQSVEAYTNSAGTYQLADLMPGTYALVFSKAGYATRTLSATVVAGGAATIDCALSRVVPKASIARSPKVSRKTYYRKKGVARFTLSAVIKGWGGSPVANRYVYLQSSTNGTKWSNTYKLKTNAYGKVYKKFRVTKARVRYYRWYVPSKAEINKKTYSAKTKVRVK